VKRSTLFASVGIAGLLGGCSSIGGFAGAVAGAASGTFTTNPAVGVGVGIAVQAATDTAFQRVFREMQANEQNRIAAIAGAMSIGEQHAWDIHHTIPFTDEHGELRVVGAIDNALTTCKEVMFSVAGGSVKAPTRQWFITQTCRQSDGQWRWAAAEPAVARWGTLQ
jgi:hypothetical protein